MRAKIEEPVEYHERCPKCGCVLITNGRAVWCTFVGGRSEPGCDFRATLRMEPETDPAVEALAAYAHEAWAGWMRYLFDRCTPVSNMPDCLVIPDRDVVRWRRQMDTPYAELPESEKESDRKEARKMLAIMSSIYQDSAKSAAGDDGVRKYKAADDARMAHLEPNE